MPVAPINFISSYGLVPIFEWVTVAPADPSTEPPLSAVTCEGTGLDAQQQPAQTDTSSPQMRLVFKGYEWRSTFGVATFPRPEWMDGLASGSDDPSDPSTKHVDEGARARKTALAAHHQPDPASTADDAATTPDPTE